MPARRRLSLLVLAAIAWTAALARADYPTEPQDVAFVARCDGSTQRYVVLLPAEFQAEQKHSLLIALHGHGSDRWQFVRNARDECRATRDVAAARGMIFVSPDYRAKTSWMGPKAEADLAQIIEEIKSRYRIDKVILCGGSMGGTSALAFTAMHPKLVDGVVSLNGTANLVEYQGFLDAIRESYGGSKTEVPDEYRRRSAEFWPERFTMPVAVTTGGKDTVVPPQSVVRLAEKIRKIHSRVLVLDRPEQGHRTDYADSKAALEFVLRSALDKD